MYLLRALSASLLSSPIIIDIYRASEDVAPWNLVSRLRVIDTKIIHRRSSATPLQSQPSILALANPAVPISHDRSQVFSAAVSEGQATCILEQKNRR